MIKQTIIGLCGPAGAGKDSVARFLTRRHEVALSGQWKDVRASLYGELSHAEYTALPEGIQTAFADPLKAICASVYDFSIKQLWGPSEERNVPDLRYPRYDSEGELIGYLTPRYALQQLGTEWGRNCYAATWIEAWKRHADKILTLRRPKILVCSDVRYQNEIDAIHAIGGRVWQVDRPNGSTDIPADCESHSSETQALTGIDHLLTNDRDLETLRHKALALLASA